MFVLGNFIAAIAKILDMALGAYYIILIVRALISWVNPDPYNPIVQFLTRITEPVLAPIRRILPGMPVDISPLIAIFGIYFLREFVVTTLFQIAYSMR